MAPEPDAVAEEGVDPFEALDDVGVALEALDENGLDADAEAVERGLDHLKALVETAEEAGDEGTETYEVLVDGRDAAQAIVDGEGTEEDLDTAGGVLVLVAENLQTAILGAILGEAAEEAL